MCYLPTSNLQQHEGKGLIHFSPAPGILAMALRTITSPEGKGGGGKTIRMSPRRCHWQKKESGKMGMPGPTTANVPSEKRFSVAARKKEKKKVLSASFFCRLLNKLPFPFPFPRLGLGGEGKTIFPFADAGFGLERGREK